MLYLTLLSSCKSYIHLKHPNFIICIQNRTAQVEIGLKIIPKKQGNKSAPKKIYFKTAIERSTYNLTQHMCKGR